MDQEGPLMDQEGPLMGQEGPQMGQEGPRCQWTSPTDPGRVPYSASARVTPASRQNRFSREETQIREKRKNVRAGLLTDRNQIRPVDQKSGGLGGDLGGTSKCNA